MSTDITREPVKQIDLIDGEWSEPAKSLAGTLDDPNTGEVRQQQMATAASMSSARSRQPLRCTGRARGSALLS